MYDPEVDDSEFETFEKFTGRKKVAPPRTERVKETDSKIRAERRSKERAKQSILLEEADSAE
jgi:hypothetical protein